MKGGKVKVLCDTYGCIIPPCMTPAGKREQCRERNRQLIKMVLSARYRTERINIIFLVGSILARPGKLSKVHFSRKFQGRVHLNFWLSSSPISPYFHPKNLPIPPKVYLLKVQGTKSKASIDFHCPLWQILLSSRQLIRIQTLLSPLWSPSRFVLAILVFLYTVS